MTLKLFPFILFLHTFLLELCNGATISSCITNERNALLDFKKNLIDEQDRLASWTHEDCCKWEGVSCNNATGHVVRLDLHNPHHFGKFDEVGYNKWSLRGQLSPSLLDLKHLNYLDLSMNHFDGHIPKFFGSLHNLRYLNLSLAGFNGLIPLHIGNLSRLRYLDLNNGMGNHHDNQYIVDDARWVSSLTSLKHLTMKNTKFENFQNWMEALNTLPNIVELCLSNGNISAFPVSLPYVNFTNLSYLDLSSNRIELESIPLWLFNIKSLTHINLSKNRFRSIPDALRNLTSLKYIDFINNELSGVVPQALKSLKDSIEHLNLSHNRFNGSLPDWFGELYKLKTLDLSYNSLSGCIPESLGRLVALQYLDLPNNKLNGTVPKFIGQLSNLVRLNLGNNHLEGVISDVYFASLTKLKELRLASNNIILNVSGDWIPPFKLNVIDMASCKLGPKFPAWLQTQANISFLDLSSSGIVDTLPNWFWDVFATYSYSDISDNWDKGSLPPISKLSFHQYQVESIYLNISNNGITGSLPSLPELCFSYFVLSSNFFKGPLPPSLNISYWVDISNNSFSGSIQPITDNQRLTEIHLSRNNFSGEIPSSICLLDGVWIDLSWNLLTGELPNCWNSLTKPTASVLDFCKNKLTGIIPHTLGALSKLQSLHLGGNDLSGNIPETMSELIELQILDLGMNKLNGTIPTWLGENFTSLTVLVLRSNDLTGTVPSNLSKIINLQILDLGNNKLFGRIPRSFGNFRNMMDIRSADLGYEFEGVLQLAIKGRYLAYYKLLTQMTSIDLSCNNLSDHVPKELGNLHGLKYLNLSGNHLVGWIPSEIGMMHSLESLDLSSNGLSGSIPLSMSAMTMLSSLNLRYNNLSGKIPTGSQLQTFTNESYIGNPKLCGFPLTKSCDSNNKTINDEAPTDEVTASEYWYVSIASGFVFGSWIVWGTFLLKKEWKDSYFRRIDNMYDAIKTAIIIVKIGIARKGDETTAG